MRLHPPLRIPYRTGFSGLHETPACLRLFETLSTVSAQGLGCGPVSIGAIGSLDHSESDPS